MPSDRGWWISQRHLGDNYKLYSRTLHLWCSKVSLDTKSVPKLSAITGPPVCQRWVGKRVGRCCAVPPLYTLFQGLLFSGWTLMELLPTVVGCSVSQASFDEFERATFSFPFPVHNTLNWKKEVKTSVTLWYLAWCCKLYSSCIEGSILTARVFRPCLHTWDALVLEAFGRWR